YKGPVYATPGTCDLLGVMLPDAAHLQEEEARYARQKGYSRHSPALPLYTVEDAEQSLTLLRPVRIGQTIEVIKGVSLGFGRVGHILGAGSARLSVEVNGQRKTRPSPRRECGRRGLGAGSARLSFEVNGQRKTFMDSGDLGRYDRPILK